MKRKKESGMTVSITPTDVFTYEQKGWFKADTTGFQGQISVDGRSLGWVFAETEAKVEAEARERVEDFRRRQWERKNARVVAL